MTGQLDGSQAAAGMKRGAEGAEGAESFSSRRARLLKSAAAMSAEEEALERDVLRPTVAASAIDPAKNFLDHKADYDNSPLLGLLRRMPKGAVLHTHGIASGDFAALVDLLRREGRFYVWQGEGEANVEGAMRTFDEGETVPEGWVAADTLPAERLYAYLTLPKNLPSVEVCWVEFGKLWDRIRLVACVAPFYYGKGKVFWDTLRQCVQSNVMYLEIKEPLFGGWTDFAGKTIPHEEVLQMFADTVREFCAENPGFLGARMVLTCLKCQPLEEVRVAFRTAVDLKERFPEYVAGFDLAGPEDVFDPIRVYGQVLEEERAAAAARGVDLPLLLHAGETNVPEATQVYDALALGCERIGHGFAFARHPHLVAELKAADVALECCPISNQVLGYFPNLAAHSGLGLLRSGVPMTISPDDPGMWHYSDVSYDFAAVAKAWNLGLHELKALVRNSLVYSTLSSTQKEEALKAWEENWQQWVASELRAAQGQACS